VRTRNFIIAIYVVIVIIISGAILVILVQEPAICDDKNDMNIIIIQPNSLTNITKVESYHIIWDASSCITDVKIELYYDSEFFDIIDNKASNDGKCIWVMYDKPDYYLCGANYTIKISDYYNSSIYATSDCFGICIDYSSDNYGCGVP